MKKSIIIGALLVFAGLGTIMGLNANKKKEILKMNKEQVLEVSMEELASLSIEDLMIVSDKFDYKE
jgi:choline kinase